MHVVEPLYKLRMIAKVEIVVALLPELAGVSGHALCHSLLRRLDAAGHPETASGMASAKYLPHLLT